MNSMLIPGRTLSIAGLTVTGGADFASAEDIASAFQTGTTVGNAVVSGVLDAGYQVSASDFSIFFTAVTPGNKPDLVVEGSGATSAYTSLTQGTQGATGPRFTNFDILRLASNNAGDAQTFDTSLLSGIQSYQIAAAAAVPGTSSVTLDQLADGASIAFLGNHGNATLNLANTAGTSDSLNVTLGNAVASNGALTDGVQVTLIAPGVETINLHSVGTAGGTGVNTFVDDAGTNTTLSTLVIDGTQALSLQLQAVAQALTVDASALAASLDVQGAAATQVLDVTGGAASDTILGGQAGGRIIGGAGGDLITLYQGGGADTVAYQRAADSRQDFVNAAGTAASTQDAISNFAVGVDKIDLKALALDAALQSFVIKSYVTPELLLADEALADFYLDNGVARGAVVARVLGDTYLVVDANGDGVFNATTDLVVKLNGVNALVAGDVVYA
ncbi:hypothetical protein FXN63_24520 [Pigmentiphaga aceris]|uniref:Peptidase M10 serralysin C-terminal domain-containing protein n=1 Tax=Pigmentiphaga aceris TaxID=1940612 RepID=A0A5C0B314_9BURK|nr:M10 family metallopeptidase C-terminal domain-containing protein [Pigmentiphaga aceris]QEI08655.1 hypothetical protein FXN63_24520 [Pigmentiphaga aceris]